MLSLVVEIQIDILIKIVTAENPDFGRLSSQRRQKADKVKCPIA